MTAGGFTARSFFRERKVSPTGETFSPSPAEIERKLEVYWKICLRKMKLVDKQKQIRYSMINKTVERRADMAKRSQLFESGSPAERNRADGEKEINIIQLALLFVFLIFELLFLITIPAMAVVLLVIVAKVAMPYLKQSGLFQKKEKKETAKVKARVDWKGSGQKAAKKFVSRMKAEEAIEKEFKSHPHTPVSYSYDSCAKEKRLEQIRTLKNAGLLTEAEYRERRSSILAEK